MKRKLAARLIITARSYWIWLHEAEKYPAQVRSCQRFQDRAEGALIALTAVLGVRESRRILTDARVPIPAAVSYSPPKI